MLSTGGIHSPGAGGVSEEAGSRAGQGPRTRAPVRRKTHHKGVQAELPKVDPKSETTYSQYFPKRAATDATAVAAGTGCCCCCWCCCGGLRRSDVLSFEGGGKKKSEVEKSEF